MAAWVIRDKFRTPPNAEILRHLRNTSAHSDVAEELTRAGATVSGVRSYCPDPARYAFVVLHLDDFTIIGLAFGQSGPAFRVPEERVQEGVRDGGALAVELGPMWVRFEPWSNHETLAQSRERLARWCAVAAGGRCGSDRRRE
jgi:hypothetical protein